MENDRMDVDIINRISLEVRIIIPMDIDNNNNDIILITPRNLNEFHRQKYNRNNLRETRRIMEYWVQQKQNR